MRARKVRSHSYKHERRNKRMEGRGGKEQDNTEGMWKGKEETRGRREGGGEGERFNAAAGKTSGHPEELRTSAAQARSTGAALPAYLRTAAPRAAVRQPAGSAALRRRRPPPCRGDGATSREGLREPPQPPGQPSLRAIAERASLPAPLSAAPGSRPSRRAPFLSPPRSARAAAGRGGWGGTAPGEARVDRTAPRSPSKTFPAKDEGDPGAAGIPRAAHRGRLSPRLRPAPFPVPLCGGRRQTRAHRLFPSRRRGEKPQRGAEAATCGRRAPIRGIAVGPTRGRAARPQHPRGNSRSAATVGLEPGTTCAHLPQRPARDPESGAARCSGALALRDEGKWWRWGDVVAQRRRKT